MEKVKFLSIQTTTGKLYIPIAVPSVVLKWTEPAGGPPAILVLMVSVAVPAFSLTV